MNTILIGDEFERRSYEAIVIAINEGLLGIAPDTAKVFSKKKYYSPKREKDIVIDLSIEIWPPAAIRASIIYLIECKSYSKKVPVDDVEEFNSKVSQIADGGFFVKGVFITSTSFQEGALQLGKSLRFMMIELDARNNLSIKLHKVDRVSRGTIPHEDIDKKVELFFQKVFDLNKSKKIPVHSKLSIAKKANEILNAFDPGIIRRGRKISIERLISYFEKTYGVTFNLRMVFLDNSPKEVLGSFDLEKNEIQISQKLDQQYRQAFVIAHEIGHYVLHRELGITQEYYDSFTDSEYDFRIDKYMLYNLRHWVEWQANYFAACLLMPEISFKGNLVRYQISQGISKHGRIYLDSQRINRQDFAKTLIYLAEYFNTSKTSVVYRLDEFNIITYAASPHALRDELRDLSFRLDNGHHELVRGGADELEESPF